MSDRDLRLSAVFSDCGKFRNILRACWDVSRPTLGWCALNPSEAGRMGPKGYVEGDPSARKIAGFSDRLGYGGFALVNLFPFIATYPRDLKRAGYPRGDDADGWIRTMVQESCGNVVCAWGARARGLSRPREVLDLLRSLGVQPKALCFTADGIPWHPLMLSYESALLEMPA